MNKNNLREFLRRTIDHNKPQYEIYVFSYTENNRFLSVFVNCTSQGFKRHSSLDLTFSVNEEDDLQVFFEAANRPQ